MKRRLTLHVPGATFSSTMEHDDAEYLLERWRTVVCGGEDAQGVAQLDGVPVMHVALTQVTAITDEIA